MPTNWVLKQIAFPPLPKMYEMGTTLDGRETLPRISYRYNIQLTIRNQERIRRACAMADIDPSSIGLPSRQVRALFLAEKSLGKEPAEKGKKIAMTKYAKRIVQQFDR